jgi:hypothetical protein
MAGIVRVVRVSSSVALSLIMAGVSGAALAFSADAVWTINPAALRATGTVDPRFQSFNTEMLEVTGGRFWKPYKSYPGGARPTPMSPDLYEDRPPIDLGRPRLRKLAAALGPFYWRVSGTWANSTFFHDSDGAAPAKAPQGFNAVVSRQQWKGVVDFARAVNADLMISFAISDGARDAQGVWKPDQARALLSYTKSLGGRIAAAEFMNEPDVANHGAAPKGYDAAAYARDMAVFRPFLKQTTPRTVLAGPGSVFEGGKAKIPIQPELVSEKLLQATGPVYDIFSYHLYAALSERCGGAMPGLGTTVADALSEDWLSRPDAITSYYAGLRDRFEPGKPIWLTETADTGCGGNPWASTFLDTFRYLDQHARLAQQGVQVIAHNTLSASDYGLLDEKTLEPRPDYWAALLWRRLMGTTVLKPSTPSTEGLHLFAQCLSGVPGGVTVLALNTDRARSKTLSVTAASERYTLTAASENLEDTRVELNGVELKLGGGDAIPRIDGVRTSPGNVTLPAASVTFLAVRNAHNSSCEEVR